MRAPAHHVPTSVSQTRRSSEKKNIDFPVVGFFPKAAWQNLQSVPLGPVTTLAVKETLVCQGRESEHRDALRPPAGPLCTEQEGGSLQLTHQPVLAITITLPLSRSPHHHLVWTPSSVLCAYQQGQERLLLLIASPPALDTSSPNAA